MMEYHKNTETVKTSISSTQATKEAIVYAVSAAGSLGRSHYVKGKVLTEAVFSIEYAVAVAVHAHRVFGYRAAHAISHIYDRLVVLGQEG